MPRAEVTKQYKTTVSIETRLLTAIDELTLRVNAVERKQTIVADAFGFIADQTRNIYGLTNLGPIFDAVTKKLRK